MNIAEWILVIMLSCALFIFLVVGILLLVKLIHLANEASKIVTTGQGIAAKADDIVDNVKGMTSVGGIVKTFADRVVENQERRYAAEDAERKAEEKTAAEAASAAEEAMRSAAAQQATEEAAVNEAMRRRASSRNSSNDEKTKQTKAKPGGVRKTIKRKIATRKAKK